MASSTVNVATVPLTAPSSTEIRDNFLRTIKNGMQRIDIPNPNVGEGSDFWIEGTAIGNEIEVAMAGIQVKADQLMPDTSTGEDLVRWAEILKLSNGAGGYGKRVAVGAAGYVFLLSAANVTLSVGEQLLDTVGNRFEVTIGGVYAPNSLIPVRGVDTGDTTNHAAGDTLKWATPPYSAKSYVTVSDAGLTNGLDEETEAVLQQRVLTRLGNPPGGGNSAQVSELCTASNSQVQAGFVYPALQGPATAGIAVVGYPTKTNKTRAVNSVVLNSTVIPYIGGNLPEHASFNITTVVDVNADVTIGINIPDAQTASPPGPGGGWENGTCWPQIDVDNNILAAIVTVVTNTTSITLTARPNLAAQANVTKISWVPYSGDSAFTAVTATVTSVVESPAGTYAITLDSPLPGIAVGDYIFPAAVNVQEYVDAVVDSFAAMGPGEKRNPIISREFRHPVPGVAWPNTLGGHILRSVINSGDEVLDSQWYSRLPNSNLSYAAQNTNGSVGVPTLITDPPRIFIPRRIGFYRLV